MQKNIHRSDGAKNGYGLIAIEKFLLYDGLLKENQDDTQLNLTSQRNGVYLYRVTAPDGSLIGEGKLIITK